MTELILGTNGNDFIMVESAIHYTTVRSGAGNDIVLGNDGIDFLFGGAGNDMLFGGNGKDELYGGDGDDFLLGGSGTDEIYGGSGSDDLFGGSGDDDIHGGTGNDELNGGAGDDCLHGGAGADGLTGGAGADTFVFYADSGLDIVLDFNTDEGDVIDLSNFVENAGYNDGTTIQDIFEDYGSEANGNVMFNFDDGNMLMLTNTQFTEISDAFIL